MVDFMLCIFYNQIIRKKSCCLFSKVYCSPPPPRDAKGTFIPFSCPPPLGCEAGRPLRPQPAGLPSLPQAARLRAGPCVQLQVLSPPRRTAVPALWSRTALTCCFISTCPRPHGWVEVCCLRICINQTTTGRGVCARGRGTLPRAPADTQLGLGLALCSCLCGSWSGAGSQDGVSVPS